MTEASSLDSDRQHDCYKVKRHNIDQVLVLLASGSLRFRNTGEVLLSDCTVPRNARSSPNQTTTKQPNRRDDQHWENGVQEGDGPTIGIKFDVTNQLDLNCVVPDRDQFACRTQ